MSDQGGTAPGWYPDPNDPATQRYWDGSQWTEHTAPVSGEVSASGAGGGTPSFPSGAGDQTLPKIDTWLWQSIVVTILCCLPAGVVGIVFSSQAQSALNVGNIAEAEAKAKQAKQWTVIGFVVGLVVLVGYFLLMIFGVVAGLGFGL